jgi:excisionase family DNA binding protein
MSTELGTLAADPARIADVAAADLPALIGEAEALRARLWARLQATSAQPTTPAPAVNGNGADRLLTVDEAADRLGVSRRWVYRHVKALPFVRRLSGGTLRFSEKGLTRWQETRR